MVGDPDIVESPIAGYTFFAAVRDRYISASHTLPFGAWQHLAAVYNEFYALRFEGEGDYVDCGNLPNFGSQGDLTLEFTFIPRAINQYHPILQKGGIGRDAPELTCWLNMLRVASNSFQIYFAYEDGDGNLHVADRTFIVSNQNAQRIAVTGKLDDDDNYTVRIYHQRSAVANHRFSGGGPVTSSQPLELGRVYGTPRGGGGSRVAPDISGDDLRYLNTTIGELRLWNRALEANELYNRNTAQDNIVASWRFAEGTGNITRDTVRQQDARIVGASWVPDIIPANTRLGLYVNGLPVAAETMAAIAPPENQFSLAREFAGELDEVRIWQEARSREQLLDNLFSHLKGDRRQLLAYYEFDNDPMVQNEIQVKDGSLRGNHLASSARADIQHVFSSAPIADDAILVRNVLGSVPNRFQQRIDGRPAIAEYADLQTSQTGEVSGIHKRCYCFVRNRNWHLFTGYKVGTLITEWISQVQFDPQIVGYIEGAPPTPSENLTAGPVNDASRDYVDTTSVEFVESDNVSYTISTSRTSGFNSSFEATLSASVSAEKIIITAPLGIGVGIMAADLTVQGSVGTKLDTDLQWSSSEQQGSGVNISRNASVSLRGNWGPTDISLRLNKALPRRYVATNVGFAIVESETADLYAIRLAHNRALVAFRILPNPDIPRDTNLLSFPINPRYTKQGTLDGTVGYDQNGKVLDPDYPQASSYGEYSYFKPSEAYALRLAQPEFCQGG